MTPSTHAVAASADGSPATAGGIPTVEAPRFEVGEACGRRDVVNVAAAIGDSADPCRAWFDGTAGRVLMQEPSGSAVLWTRRTERKTGIVVSAFHTQASASSPLEAKGTNLASPSDAAPLARLHWYGRSGLDGRIAPLFEIFRPPIPPAEANELTVADIPPRYDFFMAGVDGQRSDGGRPRFTPIVDGPIDAYDPLHRTLSAPTWAEPSSGQRLLLLGYADEEGGRRLVASVGVVLDEAAIRRAMHELARVGDEEGMISYDPRVEALVECAAVRGMSGGGAFDTEGRLVGVVVRGTSKSSSRPLSRVVRMSHIVAQVRMAERALTPSARHSVAPYLGALD